MRQKATVGGRSFLFNLLFVLFNLGGLALVVMGSHRNFENYFVLLSFIGYLIMSISAAGIFIFQGRLMIANVARGLVGGLFIISGLIKANDPIGFSYKLEEYFEDGALAYRIKELFGSPGFSLEFLIEWALFLSVVISLLEIVLGVLTLLGGKIKLVSYSLLVMMLFFTFLTWHTANCDPSKKFVDRDTYAFSDQLGQLKMKESKTNKDIKIISMDSHEFVVEEKKHPQCVTDCGCFGDAMKGSVGRSLTPSESFWKDLVLLYLVLWIFVAQWIIHPNTKNQNVKFLLSTVLVIGFFSFVFSWYFPLLFAAVAIIGALWMKREGGVLLGNFFGVSLVVFILSFILITYVRRYEPLKDYRPYAVGSNLRLKIKDGQEGKYESVLVYKNRSTGEFIEYSSTSKEYTDSKIWEDNNWVYHKMTQKEIIPTRLPSITEQFNPFVTIDDIGPFEKDLSFVRNQLLRTSKKYVRILDLKKNKEFTFDPAEYDPSEHPDSLFKNLGEVTIEDPLPDEISIRDLILNGERVFVLSVKRLSEANWKEVERYKSIFAECKRKSIPFVMICNASRKEINDFRNEYGFRVPAFANDETELKAIARSNPSLLIVEKGIVKGKYPHRSTPKFEWLMKNVLN
jgi:uncharacterized membrane protein YphA (DoxX/SURF4 family)